MGDAARGTVKRDWQMTLATPQGRKFIAYVVATDEASASERALFAYPGATVVGAVVLA